MSVLVQDKLDVCEKKAIADKQQIRLLKKNLVEYTKACNAHEGELEKLKLSHGNTINELEAAHEQQILQLVTSHERQIKELKTKNLELEIDLLTVQTDLNAASSETVAESSTSTLDTKLPSEKANASSSTASSTDTTRAADSTASVASVHQNGDKTGDGKLTKRTPPLDDNECDPQDERSETDATGAKHLMQGSGTQSNLRYFGGFRKANLSKW